MDKIATKADIKEIHKEYYVLRDGQVVDRKLFDTAVFLGEQIKKLKRARK